MDHITLAGADTPERQTLAAIVADLSRPDPSVSYQDRAVYDGPWVIAGEGPWCGIAPGEVYLLALWSRSGTRAWISSSGEVRWGVGSTPDAPSMAGFRAIVEAYQSAQAQASRRAA